MTAIYGLMSKAWRNEFVLKREIPLQFINFFLSEYTFNTSSSTDSSKKAARKPRTPSLHSTWNSITQPASIIPQAYLQFKPKPAEAKAIPGTLELLSVLLQSTSKFVKNL